MGQAQHRATAQQLVASVAQGDSELYAAVVWLAEADCSGDIIADADFVSMFHDYTPDPVPMGEVDEEMLESLLRQHRRRGWRTDRPAKQQPYIAAIGGLALAGFKPYEQILSRASDDLTEHDQNLLIRCIGISYGLKGGNNVA
ncbi:hypothetical protein [Haloglycomyces albus]|uniref:hypothetical protein n=1 Tax=Haloglycomyces albus TaxID=526067 RepID=UPI00046C94FB|nr:hypothetical protein [Haloglycomyces albus]